ncbi:uncharacterized protein LOC135953283 isoform X2 [Calliphora vicina]|uniref:uncharacterized protein LOC135953283 isoform X2 n=1 Tax=Calliphora vicina TaxID=7373 RepID=UPI00325BA264
MYLIQTVQSSWRPQLPLPKEVHLSNENINRNHLHHLQPEDDDVDIDEIQIIDSDMERFHLSSNNKKDSSLNGSQLSNASHNGSNSNKKWSFGRLFRRKKEVETESSSEEDRKAGFVPTPKYNRSASNPVAAITSTPNKKTKSSKSASRGSKLMSGNFDHVVMSPAPTGNSSQNLSSSSVQHVDNEFFLPVETVPAQEPYYQNNPHVQAPQPQQRLHHSQQYLPHVPQTQQQLMSRSAHSLDRRSKRTTQKLAPNGVTSTDVVGSSSEEEEIISLNSTTFAKYRSDESIHSGGQAQANGQSRRSRAARNERYYKRLSRDGEVSHGQVPVMYAQQPTQRWKTQPVPLSIYQAPKQQVAAPQQPQPQMRSSTSQNTQYSRLRNTNSLQHMAPYVQWGQMQQQQQPKNLQNSVNDTKRSISYDSHIHLQNVNGRLQNKPMPPPPPPRDPLRRVNVSGHTQDGSAGDLRPMSYAFDQTGVPVLPTSGLNGRCVSDDKIWAQQPHYQSIHSLNITPNQASQQAVAPANRRFITRAERDAHPGKKSLPNGLDFHYVADATPRSRKPIHLLEPNTFENDINDPTSNGILRTTKSGLPISPTKTNPTEFWKRLEGSKQNVNTPTPAPRGRDIQRSTGVEVTMKPRSVSSSRVGELRAYPVPMYSEVYKPKAKPSPLQATTSPSATGGDEVDSVICGTLHIKPTQDNSNNYVEIRNKDTNKAQSMPNHYHRRSGEIPTTPNKYEEYVNERREQNQNPLFDAPQPPQRKLSGVPHIPQLSFPRKKPANLEEAINELEAIYRSLGLTEEPETKKERIATPNDFEKYALAHADEYDDEDSPAGEPDPIRDDVAYRNIKLANLQHRAAEKQPPFGIPLGPIVPAAQTDYLHVQPKHKEIVAYETTKAPDVIKDDLAVRALRKDPTENKGRFQYPSGSLLKKNRATRTQSANIYALIQRDAAKPSGGDLHSYMELTKNIDRSGSMSDLHKNDSASDIPTTLKLLQSLREQDREQNQAKKANIPFRHPSQGGAICQLPEKLSAASHEEEKTPKAPVPMPRKSLTPEPQNTDTHKMEEALNKIAQDAQESSIKLTQELKELRKEALITASKPKKPNPEEERLVKELQEIEKVSQAAKKCGEMLLDTLPDNATDTGDEIAKPRKLHKEDNLIKAIDQVSEAANKVCEKILKDIVTTEPPVVVQEAVRVTQKPSESKPAKEENLVMPTLIKKLDPINSTNIEAIARRCMRQLSDLADSHDYDNLNQPDIAVASSCNMQQVTKDETTNDLTTSNLTETRKPPNKPNSKQQIEEIDQIMKECEDQAKQQQQQTVQVKGVPVVVTHHQQQVIKAPGSSTTTASSFSSSSDCLAKSSSPSGSRRFSSSITSFNPYSSSDYIKSPSSEFHAPSTDPIKTFSTTSYDVQSTTSATPNLTTNSTFSYSPSPPPLNLTPISNCSATIASNTQRGRSSSPSQYNSSEELAMIFGIEEKSKAKKLQNNSGKDDVTPNATTTTTPELLLEQENLNTNAASPPDCNANSDNYQYCAKTNDCLLLLLNPNSCSHTTNNASSTPMSSTSSSTSSSRLETIPEFYGEGLDGTPQESVKLSANFNKIYASKLSIFVDRMREEQTRSPQPLTQCDSLSSLEETSSNPDSGNVSLADFPLGQQNLNVSLQLSSNYNTRFEVRNCFKSEVTIDSNKKQEKDNEELVEFPRLPTAEELEESLKERYDLEENLKKTEEFLGEQSVLREKLALAKEDHELMGERIIWARDEIMAEVKALEEKALREKTQNEANKLGEEQEEETLTENYSSLKLDNSNSLSLEESEIKVPLRKRSIIIETPQLEMNIMEERINYEFSVNKEDSKQDPSNELSSLEELSLNCQELNEALQQEVETLEEDTKALSLENTQATNNEENPTQTETDLRLRVWQPPQNPDELPSTSSKVSSNMVVNVLGERRQAVNGLTLLEHLVAACTLGIINTDDMFTLCLIIIGIIIVIAIALF